MIPATRPYKVRFKHEMTDNQGKTTTYYTERPVIAWDDNGIPLVAGDRHLVPANTYKNYAGLCEDDENYIAAIPGDGWKIAWKQADGSPDYIEPVLAWVVTSEGNARPISTDLNGEVDFVRPSSDIRMIAPGEEPPSNP
ncbi:hypothetical protein ACWDR1_29465 [Streptosporangium sandarakinum]